MPSNKIKNSVPQLHWPHFKCSIATLTRGYCPEQIQAISAIVDNPATSIFLLPITEKTALLSQSQTSHFLSEVFRLSHSLHLVPHNSHDSADTLTQNSLEPPLFCCTSPTLYPIPSLPHVSSTSNCYGHSWHPLSFLVLSLVWCLCWLSHSLWFKPSSIYSMLLPHS